MGSIGKLILLLSMLEFLMGTAHAQQSSYYRRTYYSRALPPPQSRYYSHQSSLAPVAYSRGDLITEETKPKPSKGYSKKIPFHPFASDEDDYSNERYTSAEYSNESQAFPSKESDSQEYTIGTQIRVQHPITVPKKHTSLTSSGYSKYSKYKGSPKTPSSSSSSYSDANLSTELHSLLRPPNKPSKSSSHLKFTDSYDPDPFHVISPPSPSSSSSSASSASAIAIASTGYNVYEPEDEGYELPALRSRTKANLREKFKDVASKKQIEKYLEDQQKLLDDALRLQLLQNPKLQKLLRNTDAFEDRPQYDHDLPPQQFRSNFDEHNNGLKSNRPRRRPQGGSGPPRGKTGPPQKPKRKYRSAVVISV